MIKKVTKMIWGIVGILAIVLLIIAIYIGIDIKNTTTDIKDTWSEVTIGDIRNTLNIVEKQLDKDILALQLEQQRVAMPLEWTTENWRNYLDFCGEYGYVVSDYTWREYRYGRLVP